MNARLAAVLQAGHNATSTGNLKDLTPRKDKAPPGGQQGQRGAPLAKPQAKITPAPKPKPPEKAVTGPAAIKVAPPAQGYAEWIQKDIKRYEANRASDLKKVADAVADARACRQKVDEINAAEQAESAKDAKGLISELAAALTKKAAEYNVVQQRLDELVAKSGNDNAEAAEAASAAMAAEKLERQGEKARLEKDLEECKASMKSDLATHDNLVLDLRSQITKLTDANTKSGDADKAKIAKMQKDNQKASEEYKTLHKKVCEMLASFKVPSSAP